MLTFFITMQCLFNNICIYISLLFIGFFNNLCIHIHYYALFTLKCYTYTYFIAMHCLLNTYFITCRYITRSLLFSVFFNISCLTVYLSDPTPIEIECCWVF